MGIAAKWSYTDRCRASLAKARQLLLDQCSQLNKHDNNINKAIINKAISNRANSVSLCSAKGKSEGESSCCSIIPLPCERQV